MPPRKKRKSSEAAADAEAANRRAGVTVGKVAAAVHEEAWHFPLVAAAPARLTRPNGPFINGLRTSRKSTKRTREKRGRKPIPASAFIQTGETRPAPHKHII